MKKKPYVWEDEWSLERESGQCRESRLQEEVEVKSLDM